MLVLASPCNVGTTRLPAEVLLGERHRAQVTYIDGRSQRLVYAGDMAEVLKEQGMRQLQAQRKELQQARSVGAFLFSIFTDDFQRDGNTQSLQSDPRLKLFEERKPSSLNDVIEAYGCLLNVRSQASETLDPGYWPVICIDFANVLMEWDKVGADNEAALDALLQFLVKVSESLLSDVAISERA